MIRALFFLQARTGELCPSKRAIARAAGVCERDALTRLRDCGVIGWQRRCKPGTAFAWVQVSSAAYYLKPASEWRGFRAGAEAAAAMEVGRLSGAAGADRRVG